MKKAKTFTIKIIYILLIFVMLSPSLLQTISLATSTLEVKSALVKYDKDCELNLQFWNASKNRWSYVTCSYVYYEQNGKQYPAYCLDKGSPGVGNTSNSSGLNVDPYTVNVTELISDVRIWRTAINGYPYKTPSELGVKDKYDAFLATKQAIYCILYGTDPETYYKGPNSRGQAIKDAIVKMVDIGRNGTQTPSNVEVSVSKVGSFVEDGDYYSQEYKVNSPVDSSQYTITATNGLPNGSKITNMSNTEKTTFSTNEHFKVRILKSQLTENLNAVVVVQSKCKVYPVFFGETTIPGTQDYLLTFDPYRDMSGASELNVTVEGEFNLSKIASDNNIWTGTLKGEGVPNATYTIKNSNGDVVKNITTNSKGKMTVTLPVGSYTIFESVNPDNYLKDPTIYSFTIETHGSSATVNVKEDVVEGGYFSAKKESADNNIWTNHKKNQAIEKAKFGLYDENGTLIDTKISTTDGILWKKYKLKCGKYYILELENLKWFKENNEKHWFEIKENEEEVNLTVKNNVVEGGYFSARKTSSLNNIWTGHKVNDPVAGATYGIYTLDGKIVEIDGEKAIRTADDNGEIFNKYKLELGDYYMQEIEPAPYFQKDETKHYFTIEKNEQLIELDVQNRPIEGGYVNIFKSALENNLWTGTLEGDGVANATYRIESLTVEGWYIDVTTNSEGKIIEKNFTTDNIELLLRKI